MLLVLLLLQSFSSGEGLLFWRPKPPWKPIPNTITKTSEYQPGILPKSKAKGIDFCAVGDNSYIIRSDLGCYMRSTNFHKGENLHIFGLHNSVQGGDHYLAHQDDLFYVIKGDSYRRVTSLQTDENAVVYNLHPNCRNGDYYYSSEDSFYIVFQKKGVYRRVTDMSKDSNAHEFHIHPDLKDGLYYWGNKDFVFLLKPRDKWGIQYHRTTSLNTNSDPLTLSFHGDVVNFLPGGLAVNYGKSFGAWKALKSIDNLSQLTVTWEETVEKKVGYEKKKTSQVESNWQISSSLQAGTGALVQSIFQAQLSMSADYGGSGTNTEGETWSDVTKVKEKISLEVPPKSKAYIWQYQMGMGSEELLFSSRMSFTDTPDPPTFNPLPPPGYAEKEENA